MAVYVEGKGFGSEAEPVGLLTEGATGIAAIVLAVLALAGVSTMVFAAIVTIVIGAGLMVQAFNAAAEHSRAAASTAPAAAASEVGGEVLVDLLAGITGVILGILALVGVHPVYLIAAALIVFGSALLLAGGVGLRGKTVAVTTASGQQIVSYQGSGASSGVQVLVGIAAIVLGILSLILAVAGVLILVGFIAVGAALLTVSATFSGAMLRLFSPRTA